MPIDGVRSYSELSGKIAEKRVLVRSGLDRPFEDRLAEELPLYMFVLEEGGELWIASHSGRYKPSNPPESLRYIIDPLGSALDRRVMFFDDYEQAASTSIGQAVGLLENTRLTPADEANDPSLAKRIALVGDVIVINGASVCHRDQASVTGILNYRPGFSGPLVENEYLDIKRFSGRPEGYAVAAVGGAKLNEKMAAIAHFAHNYDVVILGGKPLNNFLAATLNKNKIGISAITDDKGKDYIAEAKAILSDPVTSSHIRLPQSVVCTYEDFSDPREFPIEDIPNDREIVDIVPDFFDPDMKAAGTAILVGPLGRYEKSFTHGTSQFVSMMPENSIVCGGDSVNTVPEYRGRKSLGGGASVELLLGNEWPAVKMLRRNAEAFKFP